MLRKIITLFVLPLMTTLTVQATDPFMQDPFGDNIFKEMMQMQQDMDKMFERMHHRMQQRTTRQIAPMCTYTIQQQNQFLDKGDHYIFITSIPESKENKIDINTQNGVMSITAKIIQKQETKMVNGYSTSTSMRMYQQSMPLPQDADEATINMEYVDGKLVVFVEKRKGISNPQIVPYNDKVKSDKKGKENNTSIKKMPVGDSSSMS